MRLIRMVTGLMLGMAVMIPVDGAAQVGKNLGLVYVDVATKEDLLKLPHLNATLADALINARPYANMLAVDKVLSTLSAAQRNELYAKLWLPINLNTATRAEIMLIAGMGERMAHEFEEYRPYRAMAQFRREIGKYVNAQEVARFEQFVFVPIDLNTASDADILSIPGLGQRMLHEFKEYRPYPNIEKFRREIGKYVDQKEVARFERYVTIRQD